MNDSSDLKLKLLDDLCDKLDKSGIEGNVIERDSRGRPYVNIWYGKYVNPGEMFTVVVTDYSLYFSPNGCYEIKPPNKYADYFDSTFRVRRTSRAPQDFISWDLI